MSNQNKPAAYIYDAVRTPRGKGKTGGALNEVKPIDLLASLLAGLKERHNLDTSQVDDVVMGCVQALNEQGADLGRTAVLRAGWDESVPGIQLDRFCGSGLEAVNLAAAKVMSGWEDVVVAGGVESMSRVKMGVKGGAWTESPSPAFELNYTPQGIGADFIATMEGFTREDVDNFAFQSQQKAAIAQKEGRFDKSIIPVKDANGIVILEKDEYLRPSTTMEGLGKLKAAFGPMGEAGYADMMKLKYPWIDKIDYVHHGGNSSGIVDGAAAVIIGNENAGKKLGLKPRARIVATASVGTEPSIMLTGPAPATFKVLEKAGLSIDDIDLFEVNEAFAAVVLKFQKDTGVAFEKINVNGGSISFGHPLGATGAMLIGVIVDELERRGLRYGLITLCVAAGMGIATIVERIEADQE